MGMSEGQLSGRRQQLAAVDDGGQKFGDGRRYGQRLTHCAPGPLVMLTLVMPWFESSRQATSSGANAWVRLGQPLLLSNLVEASNKTMPQHTQP